MIGIDFGVDRKNQKIGDLLISERVIPYEPQKIATKNGESEDRGKAGPAGTHLLNRVRNVHNWSPFTALCFKKVVCLLHMKN
jgi:hypothetical protein